MAEKIRKNSLPGPFNFPQMYCTCSATSARGRCWNWGTNLVRESDEVIINQDREADETDKLWEVTSGVTLIIGRLPKLSNRSKRTIVERLGSRVRISFDGVPESSDLSELHTQCSSLSRYHPQPRR